MGGADYEDQPLACGFDFRPDTELGFPVRPVVWRGMSMARHGLAWAPMVRVVVVVLVSQRNGASISEAGVESCLGVSEEGSPGTLRE